MFTVNNKTKFACFRWVLGAVFLFNIIDTFITLYVTQRGFVELNPVTRILLYFPSVFAFVKITLVSLLLYLLWRKRAERLARVASWVAFGIYGAVMVHYCITFLLLGVMI